MAQSLTPQQLLAQQLALEVNNITKGYDETAISNYLKEVKELNDSSSFLLRPQDFNTPNTSPIKNLSTSTPLTESSLIAKQHVVIEHLIKDIRSLEARYDVLRGAFERHNNFLMRLNEWVSGLESRLNTFNILLSRAITLLSNLFR